MTYPKIDLIIPLFNKKNHITRCLNSALNQQKRKFNRIIVVNDGSTDGVENILNGIKKDHLNVLILNQENKGVSAARNEGLKMSKADYVVFLDADDELNTFYLYEIFRLILKFKKDNIKVFSTKHRNIFIDKNPDNKKTYLERKANLKLLSNPLLNISTNKHILCASGICFQKNLIEKNLFPKNIKIGEDIYVWEKILLNQKLAWSNQELIYVYKNAENRAQELNNDVPYYILQYHDLYKEIKNFKTKIAFIFFHVLSIFIIINQFKNRKILDSAKFKKIYKKQNVLIKILCILFRLNISHYLYKFIVFLRKIFSQIKTLSILIYFLITPTAPIIFFILFLKEQKDFASLFLFYSSFVSLLIFLFSLQNRLYLYKSYPKYSLNYIISYRLISSFFIYLFSLIFFFIFIDFKYFYLFLFCLNSLLSFWLIEIILLRLEKFSNNKSIYILFTFILFYYLSIIFIPSNYKYYTYISSVFIILILVFSIFLFLIKKYRYIKMIKKKILTHYAFYFFWSGILFSLSNYLFRFILIENINLVTLSYYFLIFSITTMPSTIYYTVIGQYSLTSEVIRKTYFWLIHIVLLIIFIYLNYKFQNVLNNILNLLIMCFFGSILLLHGHMYRAKQVSELYDSKAMLLKDFYFFLICAFGPIIVLIDKEYISYLILLNGSAGIIIFYLIGNFLRKN